MAPSIPAPRPRTTRPGAGIRRSTRTWCRGSEARRAPRVRADSGSTRRLRVPGGAPRPARAIPGRVGRESRPGPGATGVPPARVIRLATPSRFRRGRGQALAGPFPAASPAVAAGGRGHRTSLAGHRRPAAPAAPAAHGWPAAPGETAGYGRPVPPDGAGHGRRGAAAPAGDDLRGYPQEPARALGRSRPRRQPPGAGLASAWRPAGRWRLPERADPPGRPGRPARGALVRQAGSSCPGVLRGRLVIGAHARAPAPPRARARDRPGPPGQGPAGRADRAAPPRQATR